MPIVAYIQEPSEHDEERTEIFGDLIAFQDPEYAPVGTGSLVLTLAQDGAPLPYRRFTATALYEVTGFEETGDALFITTRLVQRFSEAASGGGASASFDRAEIMKALNWYPSPTRIFKPFPFVAWAWLAEKKGLPLPGLT